MPKRASMQIRLAAAVALAGMGHYYLLLLPAYYRDALLFYAVVTILLIGAYRRAEAVPQEAVVDSGAPRSLAAAAWGFLAGGPTKVSVAAMAALNGSAALVSALMVPPAGVAVALIPWILSLVPLIASLSRPAAITGDRAAESAVEAEQQIGRELEPETGLVFEPGWRETVPALAGWVLLSAGLWLVDLRQLPAWLAAVNPLAGELTASMRVDVPAQPAAWMLGLAILALGMLFVFLSRAGVGALRGSGGFSSSLAAARPASVPEQRRGLAVAGALIWVYLVLAAAGGSTGRLIGPLWLLAIGLLGVHFWQADRSRNVRLIPTRLSRSVWMLVPALVAALLVLLYRLEDVPASFWGDEGACWWLAKAIAEGLQKNPFALGVYNAHPVAVTYYHSLWLRLFGATLWSWRLGSVVAGVLAIVPLFLLARRTLGSRVAWSAVVLLIGMPYFLAYSRLGFYAIQPIMPAALAIYLLVEAVGRGSWTLAYLAGVSCGLASLAYAPGHAALAISMLVLAALFLARKGLRRVVLLLALLVLVGWLCAAGPFFLGTGLIGGEPVGAKVVEHFIGNVFYGETVFPDSEVPALTTFAQVGQDKLFFDPELYALLGGRGLVRTGLNVVSDFVVYQHYLVGPLAGPAVLFFLVGLAWAVARLRRWEILLWPVWVVLGLLMLSAFNSFPPRVAHLAVIFPAVAALGAVGIWLLVELVRRLLPFRWVDAIGVAVTVAVACFGLYAYFVEMPERYPPGLDSVILWRAMDAEPGTSFVYISDPAHPFGYRKWGMPDYDLGFELRATIQEVPRDELAETDLVGLCGGKCSVFFVPDEEGSILEQVEAQLGPGNAVEHEDYGGQTIGVEFVPEAGETG